MRPVRRGSARQSRAQFPKPGTVCPWPARSGGNRKIPLGAFVFLNDRICPPVLSNRVRTDARQMHLLPNGTRLEFQHNDSSIGRTRHARQSLRSQSTSLPVLRALGMRRPIQKEEKPSPYSVRQTPSCPVSVNKKNGRLDGRDVQVSATQSNVEHVLLGLPGFRRGVSPGIESLDQNRFAVLPDRPVEHSSRHRGTQNRSEADEVPRRERRWGNIAIRIQLAKSLDDAVPTSPRRVPLGPGPAPLFVIGIDLSLELR